MEVFLKNRKGMIYARGEYNEDDGSLTVFKGSVISADVAGGTFRSAKAVKQLRNNPDIVNGNSVINDVVFKSPSAAANFITGTSTNGLKVWKNKDMVPLKEILYKSE